MSFGDRVTRRHILRLRQQEAEDEARKFTERNDWDLLFRTPADKQTGSEYEVVWLTPANLTFNYREDQVARQGYVYLEGDDFEVVDLYENKILEGLPTWSVDELLQAVDETPEGPDRSLAVLRAGLGAPIGFDQRFLEVIEGAVTDDDSRRRKVGVLASSYSPWPQYRPLLDQLAADDPDTETRDLAQATLRAFDRHGVPES